MQKVVDHLNKVCGTVFPPFAKPVRQLVAQLLVDGYTIEDIKAVNEWANERWAGGNEDKDYWRGTMLVPSQLYGEKFSEHLGVALGKAKKSSDGTDSKADAAGIPLEDIFGTPEYEAKMKHASDRAERLVAK